MSKSVSSFAAKRHHESVQSCDGDEIFVPGSKRDGDV